MDIFIVCYMVLVAIVIGCLVAKLCQKCWEVPAAIIVVAIFLTLFIFLPPATAEETVTVIAVFYENDTFIVEDANGNRDLYDNRGDLVPGDQLIIRRDEVKLIAQSDWVWFDFSIDGEAVASFLYAEDAQWIREAITK